jgi:uncharacterized RDD family membrane protein YckC
MKTYDAHETKVMKRLHGVTLASFGRRAAAILIDIGFGTIFIFLVAILIEPILRAKGWVTDEKPIKIVFFGNWYCTLGYALYFALAAYFGKGRTPGKRLVRIRIASLTHDHLTFWQCVERSMAYGFSVLELGFGFFQFFINPNRRTVHDRVAETVVILDDRTRNHIRKPHPSKQTE